MQLKRFVGETTPATLSAVRKAFGDEALILSNRRVGNQVEIIATGEIDEAELAGAERHIDAPAGSEPMANAPESEAPVAASATSSTASTAEPHTRAEGQDGSGRPARHEIPMQSVPGTPAEVVTGDAAELLKSVADASGRADSAPDAPVSIAQQAEETARKHRSLRERASELLHSQKKARDQEITALANDIVTLSGAAPVKLGQTGTTDAAASTEFADIQARVVRDSDGASPTAASANDHTDADSLAAQDAAATGSLADPLPGNGSALDTNAAQNAEQLSASVVQALEGLLARQAEAIEERFQRLEASLWGTQDKARAALVRQMMHLGLGAELSVRLVERLRGDASEEAMFREALALLKASLPVATDHSISEPGVTVLSGPAGSGKTTALVKLATQYVKANGNQSIVMICADARRIGAFDLLQTYGRLLGIPVVQAHDSEELANLIAAFAHKSLVLVDHTMPGSESALALPELPIEGQGHDLLRHLLVLPATLQAAAAESIVAAVADSTISACVLTQLDQCTRLGELFGALIRHHLRIAYWSDTAQVQQPLHHADASILVATAMAMGRRVPSTPDDQWLQNLLQPARHGLPLAL